VLTGFIWLIDAGSCEHGNEPSGSIKGGEFIDQLSECQFLTKDPAALVCLFVRIHIICVCTCFQREWK